MFSINTFTRIKIYKICKKIFYKYFSFNVKESLNESCFNTLVPVLCIYATFLASHMETSLVSYSFALLAICMHRRNFQLTYFQYTSIIICLLFLFFLLLDSEHPISMMKNIRYWYGFIIFVIFFKSINLKINFNAYFFRFLCALVLVEAICQNLDIVQYSDYIRPLSFGGNASISSSLLLLLFLITEKNQNTQMSWSDFFLLLITIVSLMSGTGFVGFLIILTARFYSGIKNNIDKKVKTLYCVIFVFILSTIGILSFSVNRLLYQKYSIGYYVFIIQNKIQQIKDTYFFNNNVIGGQGRIYFDPITAGDFGWLVFIDSMGFAGFFLYFLILFSFLKNNKKYKLIILFLLVVSSHYPTAMSQGGQLFLAYVLVKADDENYCREN